MLRTVPSSVTNKLSDKLQELLELLLATKNFISCEHSQSPDGRNTECTECLICTDGGFIFSYSRLVLNQETSFYPFVLSDNK